MKNENDLFGLCPYVTVQKLISGKWNVLLLHFLSEKTYRFGELQKKIPELTQATLTKQLRFLEENELIIRTVYPVVPPKVEYSLSELGAEFLPVLKSLEKFGNKYIEHIKETQG